MSGLVGVLVALAVVAAAGTGGRTVGTRVRRRPVDRSPRGGAAPDLAAVLLGVCAQLRAGAAPAEAWSRALGSAAGGPEPSIGALHAATSGSGRAQGALLAGTPGSGRGALLAATSGPGPSIDALVAVTCRPARRGARRPAGGGDIRGVAAHRGRRSVRGRDEDGAVRRARAVLAAVRLSEELGAPLAGVLERIAAAVAADEEAEDERRAALAGPRSTAQVLAWLPLLGVALGALLGADPVGVVFSGGPGTVSALLGAALLLLGRWWTEALLARAGRAGDDPAGTSRSGRPRPRFPGWAVVRFGAAWTRS